MSDYRKIPSNVKAQPKPFEAHIPDETLEEFKQLLKYSKVGPAVYENQQEDRRFGITRDWLLNAKHEWETSFDWRASEKHINSFPNYTLPIKHDDGNEYTVHFIALFSENEHAIPIAFYHGWPGSFLEFLPMLSHIKSQYSAKDLPYHIIVPSLPGYTFSSGPPVDKDMDGSDMPAIMHKLMLSLGFGETGYVAQGGDLGSLVARQSAVRFEECKAFHLNMNIMTPPDNAASLPVDEEEKKAAGHRDFIQFGSAYAREHATRTATIGLVLSASPLSLLAWIGEKFLEWTDEDPSLHTILESVTLYWLTDTFPRAIYPYRSNYGTKADPNRNKPKAATFNAGDKPMGFSWFPFELVPTPRSHTELSTENLVFYRQHKSGGHFAALEQPKVLWEDVEEFIGKAWKQG